MKKQKYIVGNWKMNSNRQIAQNLMHSLIDKVELVSNNHLIIAPPFPYLGCIKEFINKQPIGIAAQDVSANGNGAFTGEVSANMLQDLGCSYVLIGHSERRENHNETAQLLAEKVACAVANQLVPIVCIGESPSIREADKTHSFLAKQLADVILPLQEKNIRLDNLIVAYEPIWAIGTGKIATPDIIWQTHDWLEYCLKQHNINSIKLLYGGSVKADNAENILGLTNVDGVLVGGASLDADNFSKIYNLASQFI
ncbi:triose-phosphate isomerase [Gammaproteobacteria bacterium]|nr:triose-phosphate isomerase [Gammaproteobacteria bacterium]